MLTEMRATFDDRNHCNDPGYATCWQHRRGLDRFRLRCWLGRHLIPIGAPHPPNGHAPSNYWTCPRCRGLMHFYVEGQHRYGSIDRYFANLDLPGERSLVEP